MNVLSKITQSGLAHALTAVLTPLGAIVAAWAAKQGFNLPVAESVTAGASAGAAVLFMGWHAIEKQPIFAKAKTDFDAYFQKLVDAAKQVPGLDSATNAILTNLESQKGEILAALEKAAHAPTSVDNLINELVNAKLAAGTSSTPSVPPTPQVQA